jgi:hypothetical protein
MAVNTTGDEDETKDNDEEVLMLLIIDMDGQ